MTFSKEWEAQFAAGSHFSQYPWSDLVALVMRHANPKKYDHKVKVLELGPGVGANIQFFLDKGFEYHAIEGSETAVKYMKNKFGDNIEVIAGDFTSLIPYEESTFDIIIDRGAITCNRMYGVKRVIEKSASILKSGGMYIGIDWYSTIHPFSKYGVEVEPNTRIDIPIGTFKNTGTVHFFTEDELRSLFYKDFYIMYLEHKTYSTIIPNRESGWASYNIVAKGKKEQ